MALPLLPDITSRSHLQFYQKPNHSTMPAPFSPLLRLQTRGWRRFFHRRIFLPWYFRPIKRLCLIGADISRTLSNGRSFPSSGKQEILKVLKCNERHILGAFEEWRYILHRLIPLDFLQLLGDKFPPICFANLRSGPPGLGQGVIQEWEVRLRPTPFRQIPGQIVQITSLQIGSRENRVEFPG